MILEMFQIVISHRMRWQAKRGVFCLEVFLHMQRIIMICKELCRIHLDISRAGAPYLLAKEVSRAISNKIHEKAVRQ